MPALAPFSVRKLTTLSYRRAFAPSSAVRPSAPGALTSTPELHRQLDGFQRLRFALRGWGLNPRFQAASADPSRRQQRRRRLLPLRLAEALLGHVVGMVHEQRIGAMLHQHAA